MSNNVKNEVLYRVYFLLFGIIVPAAIGLVVQSFMIAIQDGERWRKKGKELYLEERKIEADRGNILAGDGSMLATSVPFFDLYFDPNSSGMSEEVFEENIDSLAICLATYVDDSWTIGGLKEHLLRSRRDSVRFLPIKKKVPYAEKKFIEQFPLFREGQLRGGFIALKRSERKRPFGMLAHRTIGYVRDNALPVGLEGAFNDVLGGQDGRQPMICIDKSNDLWMPLADLTAIEPQSGDDIVTTLDINFQDIVEQALLNGLYRHQAEWGTAILMEVNTGAIKAMANLGRTDDGKFWETYNHGIGSATEPGSTFKLATIMALLEDEFVSLNDTINIERGRTQFYDETMEDSSKESAFIDSTSVRHAFEISSNVAMAKLVDTFYNKRSEANQEKGAELFIEHLKDFNLHLPTGIEVQGEVQPYIKEAYSEKDQWSGVTLPWMSIGYETKLTPLQTLNFYNTVANGGTMMRPYLVSEIQQYGQATKRFKPTVIRRSIASEKTITQAKSLLEGVVLRGTARKLKSDQYNFAGKTGTAQINYKRGRRGTRVGGYQASFVGYFPAENPVFSCIVVVRKPTEGGFYGSDVAGPIFREIADGCFASEVSLHQPLNEFQKPELRGRQLPGKSVGDKEDIKQVFSYLELPYYGEPTSEMTVVKAQADSLILLSRSINERKVPSVVGMGVRDALFILENLGLNVSIQGVGKVIRQSIRPGTRIHGQTITITLG